MRDRLVNKDYNFIFMETTPDNNWMTISRGMFENHVFQLFITSRHAHANFKVLLNEITIICAKEQRDRINHKHYVHCNGEPYVFHAHTSLIKWLL